MAFHFRWIVTFLLHTCDDPALSVPEVDGEPYQTFGAAHIVDPQYRPDPYVELLKGIDGNRGLDWRRFECLHKEPPNHQHGLDGAELSNNRAEAGDKGLGTADLLERAFGAEPPGLTLEEESESTAIG